MRFVVLGLLLLFTAFPAFAQQPDSGPEISAAEQVSDDTIETRIRQILDSIDTLSGVIVSVDAGVVTLSGEVPSDRARLRAEEISDRVEGVVAVENRTQVNRDVTVRGLAVFERLEVRLIEFVAALPLFLVALGVFLLFLWGSRIFGRHPVLISRVSPNPFLQQLLIQAIRIAIIVMGLVIALEILDATALIGAVLGAAGVTGIVLGFALKETIENYVAGLLLSLRQPFAPNDHVAVSGHEGLVIRMTSRATVLMSLEGNHVRIPNAEVFKSTLVNYSRNPERKFEFEIGVGVQTDLIEARNLAIETLRDMDAVLVDPPPEARVETLGDSNVVLKIFGWVDQRSHDIYKVRGEAIRRVKIVFEAADYDLPEPIYRLNLMNSNFGILTESDPKEVSAVAAQTSASAEREAVPGEAELDEGVDLGRDTHLDREVAQERAELGGKDMLSPDAEQE